MLYEAYNGHFGTINSDLENKMICESYSYSRTKDETMGIINNYYVSI